MLSFKKHDFYGLFLNILCILLEKLSEEFNFSSFFSQVPAADLLLIFFTGLGINKSDFSFNSLLI